MRQRVGGRSRSGRSHLDGLHWLHDHHLIRGVADQLQPYSGLTAIDHLQLLGRCVGEVDQARAIERAAIVDPHNGLQPVVQIGDPHIARDGQVAVGGAEQLAVQHIAVGGLLAVQIRRQPAGGALFAVVFDVAPHLVLLLADPVVPVAAGTQGLGARNCAGGLRDLDNGWLADRCLRLDGGALFRLAATGGQQQAQAEREEFVTKMHTLPEWLG